MKKILSLLALLLPLGSAIAQSVEILPGNNSNGNIISNSGTYPSLLMFKSGYSNPLKTIIGHSPGLFADWGLQYQDIGDKFRFSTGINDILVVDMSNTRVGVGINSPSSIFEVASSSGNDGINISKLGAGFGSGRLSIWSDRNTVNEWRPGYIESGDNGTFTGRLDFFTNGTTSANKTGSVLGMSVVNGRVGVGSSTANSPDFPLHVTSSTSTTSSTTGAFAIGETNSFHSTFDRNNIEAWNNTSGSVLYLNYYSNAKVQIGNGSTGNLDVNGFSNLGDGAPAIKMKKLTGTTAATATTTIPHGLTDSKILSVDVHVLGSTGDYYGPNSAYGSGFNFAWKINGANIELNFVGSSLQGRAYKVLLTYEQ
jgi:hypothetical protein